ncbi:MAG TPA: toll/interleukin-1 receptor domain-containing protein, partial [Aggregatilineaceae bacterium]|nr:toll/interleukin-1 receptor domain-containing protein [Aggregatilineaceae bacterium]
AQSNGTGSVLEESRMYNPLEDNVPDDPIQRIHALARDLAYGAAHGYWPTVLLITSYRHIVKGWDSGIVGTSADFAELSKKWTGALPDITLLQSFEYLVREDRGRYALTQKSFVLLEQPVPTSIFISYRRQESSTFALLILARFKALGLKPFLDVNIEPGHEWHPELEAEVNRSENFVCLVGPTTLSRNTCGGKSPGR